MISDKISSVLMYLHEILLHVSRGVRWDSDHVVTLTDELQAIAQEIVRGDFWTACTSAGLLRRQHQSHRGVGDRHAEHDQGAAVGAARTDTAMEGTRAERETYTSRLALMEEQKSLPFGAVWDYYCLKSGVPVGADWLSDIRRYEESVLQLRS